MSPSFTFHSFLAGATAFATLAASALFALPAPSAEAKPLVSYRADTATPPANPVSKAGGNWRHARKANSPFRFGTEEINGQTYHYITPNPHDGAGDNPDSFGSYQFFLTPEWINHSEGWTATAVLRVPQADSLNLHTCSFRIFDHQVEYMLSVFNDPKRNQQGVVLRSKGMELNRAGGYNDELIAFDVSSDYRTFQLYYNPTEEKLRLFIDGKEVASQERSELHPNSEVTPRIRWGKETARTSEARWSEVRFELENAVIPEKN